MCFVTKKKGTKALSDSPAYCFCFSWLKSTLFLCLNICGIKGGVCDKKKPNSIDVIFVEYKCNYHHVPPIWLSRNHHALQKTTNQRQETNEVSFIFLPFGWAKSSRASPCEQALTCFFYLGLCLNHGGILTMPTVHLPTTRHEISKAAKKKQLDKAWEGEHRTNNM